MPTNQNYFNQVMGYNQICIQLWNQEVKSCKTSIKQNFNQSQLFQPGHELRLDLHTTLEPGSEILQDPKLSKSCSKSQTSQLGLELQPDLDTVKSLEFSILQPQEKKFFLKHHASNISQIKYLIFLEFNET